MEGTVACYADDASVLAPNAPIASGQPAIHAVWASLIGPGTRISRQANKVEVARSSDRACIEGTCQLTMKDLRGNPVNDQGKFVEVWKKQADGKWKVVADIFNTDLQLAPPPAEPKE